MPATQSAVGDMFTQVSSAMQQGLASFVSQVRGARRRWEMRWRARNDWARKNRGIHKFSVRASVARFNPNVLHAPSFSSPPQVQDSVAQQWAADGPQQHALREAIKELAAGQMAADLSTLRQSLADFQGSISTVAESLLQETVKSAVEVVQQEALRAW